MSLSYSLDRRDGDVTVRFEGRIDRDASGVFDELATALTEQVIELDFGAVDYINSTGIALIVGLLARARGRKATVRAIGLTPHYLHIFEITRLSDFIELAQPAE